MLYNYSWIIIFVSLIANILQIRSQSTTYNARNSLDLNSGRNHYKIQTSSEKGQGDYPMRTSSTYQKSTNQDSLNDVYEISPQRIEYNEADRNDIYWRCPPDNYSHFPDEFEWLKLSKEVGNINATREKVLSLTNVLEIKDPSRADEGRYICLSRKSTENVSSTIHFYQFIILKTKYIDVSSSDNVSVYVNQTLVLNCPYGKLLLNERPIGSKSLSRVTIIEQSPKTSKDEYRCSNSIKEALRISIIPSSSDCSLSLLGCMGEEDNETTIHSSRCTSYKKVSSNPLDFKICPGKIFIRFYYDSNKKRCLPFETDICSYQYYSFASFKSCKYNCIQLSKGLKFIKRTIIPTSFKKIMKNIVNTKIMNGGNLKFSKRHISVTTEPKSVMPIPKVFDVSERMLSIDPCLSKVSLETCDNGQNVPTYHLIRYSFVSEYRQCHRVSYSGCNGHENLFDDANDCKASCEYRLYHSLKSVKCQSPYSHSCADSIDTSNTSQLIRYHFSPAENRCLPFHSINSSRCSNQFFNSNDECHRVCQPKQASEAILQNKCFGKIVMDNTSCIMDERVSLWFYMASIKQCLQYSTCPTEQVGNVFLTKSECQDNCLATSLYTVCSLPADSGAGTEIKMKYFYDIQREKCGIFQYKGSLGNLNRFRTKEECSSICVNVMSAMKSEPSKASALIDQIPATNIANTHPTKELELCYDSPRYGNYRGAHVHITKYYYDASQSQCNSYLFSGFGASSRNSFDLLSMCNKTCTARLHTTIPSVCSLTTLRCSNSSSIYWKYDPHRGVCDLFPSCIKQSTSNTPLFIDEVSCIRKCVPSQPLKKDFIDTCHLSPTIVKGLRDCALPVKRWFYDQGTGTCLSELSCITYGNNYPSLSECLQSCEPRNSQDVCMLPMDKGPCAGNTTMYFYHSRSHRCATFRYGGCLGNRNRFSSLKDCNTICQITNKCNTQPRVTALIAILASITYIITIRY